MTKICWTAALMLTCLFGVGANAHAQDADAVVVNVPFQFVAGNVTLPAGDYRMTRVSPDTNQELAISSYNKGSALLLPLTFDDRPTAQPMLSFEHVGGKYFLIKINTLAGAYTMPASLEMVMLGKANSPNQSTSSSAGGQ